MAGKWVRSLLCMNMINSVCTAVLKENPEQNHNRDTSHCSPEDPPTRIKVMATNPKCS
jgi:hypothetical protein